MLSAWLPVLAYYDNSGWHPKPFVPWHQPFFQEAGVYQAKIIYPAKQKLACCAACLPCRDLGDGWVECSTTPTVLRDFSLHLCENYQIHERQVQLPDQRSVTVRCYAYPKHEFFGKEMTRIASEAIAGFSQWFGAYPYSQFSIAESYFGWNGNECSGLIMIDERVFGMPHLAVNYVEYLVSHETCHQWWYNIVGTNGYSETFMDEAFATYFTHRFLDRKLGKNNTLLNWPDELKWLPNICRENYRYSSYYGTVRRHESMPAVQDLPKYGHLINLFSAAYDRGSKILGMVEDRMGEVAFMEFIRQFYHRYAFQITTVHDFQRELEAYTGQSWQQFFDRWVYGAGLTDWAITSVKVDPHKYPDAKTGGAQTTVVIQVRQRAEHSEPTSVGVRLDDSDHFPIRIPIIPGHGVMKLDDPPTVITQEDSENYRIEMTLPSKPTQVSVDPDRVLIDQEPDNNDWHHRIRVRFAPLYTMLEEADLTNDYDHWNLLHGFWFSGGTAMNQDPWYTRPMLFGYRMGTVRIQQFYGGIYSAFRSDYNDFVVGIDGQLDHWPHPKMQLGFHAERRIGSPIGTEGPSDVNRAMAFARYVLNYSSSMYLPPIQYIETFAAYQDNALPYARTSSADAQRPDRWTTAGIHYRLNYLTPYWNPEMGFQFDISYAGGVADFQSDEGMQQLQGQFAISQRLPEDLGYLSDVIVAGRIGGAAAFPDKGQFYALGGAQTFRGYDLAERQGNAFWVASAELRLPLAENIEWDVLDHTAGARNLQLVAFYDVGAIYTNGKTVGNNVAHAVGVGLRIDSALFSFIERATLRIDVGKTVNDNTPLQFWFGVQQAF
ncbi:M1 family aminopeptidase [Tuwongella immobilis]|nr:M1 family aminopeptidase [Tuwongella immobilis]